MDRDSQSLLFGKEAAALWVLVIRKFRNACDKED
jgi:hypothetical protein